MKHAVSTATPTRAHYASMLPLEYYYNVHDYDEILASDVWTDKRV